MYSAIALALLAFAATAQAKCDKGCNIPAKHYEELGCEPVFAKPDDCCPTHYNCAKFTGRSADKCHLYGKEYNLHDEVDNNITGKNCAASCHCEKGEWKEFNCADIECFGDFQPVKPGCFRIYESDHCCSSNTLCHPLEEKLAECKIGEKIYYQGERFEGPDGCTTCTCLPGFEGKFTEPFCSPVSCGIELRYSKNVRDNCAPVFYGTDRCCPIDWKCLSDKDVIVPAEKPSEITEKCKYGDKELSIGDKVTLHRDSPHNPEVNCDCRLPPLVTCIQKPHEQPEPIQPVPISKL